jgi:hypothetical protein
VRKLEALHANHSTLYSSVIDIGLVILTAGLAALKPLLSVLPWGSSAASKGVSRSGNSGLDLGPRIRLEDRKSQNGGSDTGSQDDILGPQDPRRREIRKVTRYDIEYSTA